MLKIIGECLGPVKGIGSLGYEFYRGISQITAGDHFIQILIGEEAGVIIMILALEVNWFLFPIFSEKILRLYGLDQASKIKNF